MSIQTLNTGASNDASKTPAPEGHDAAMAAKFDAAQSPKVDPNAPPAEARPEWLPAKFKTPEELAKAHAELEARFSRGEHKEQPKADEGAPKEAPKADEPNPEADAAKEAVESAGLDFNAMSDRFAEKGELPAEDYAALEKAGISRELVDSYIAGQQAIAERDRAETLAEFGGEKAYTAMVQWAAKSLDVADIAAYNAVVATGDKQKIKLAVAGLQARYEAANGREPNLVNTDAANGPAGFESRAQVVAAMSDPRYAKDPAYRESVAKRIAASSSVF